MESGEVATELLEKEKKAEEEDINLDKGVGKEENGKGGEEQPDGETKKTTSPKHENKLSEVSYRNISFSVILYQAYLHELLLAYLILGQTVCMHKNSEVSNI